MRLGVRAIVDPWVFFHFVDVVLALTLSSLPQVFVYRQNGTGKDRSDLVISSSDNRHAAAQCTACIVCVRAWCSVTMPSLDRSGFDVSLEPQYSINLEYPRHGAGPEIDLMWLLAVCLLKGGKTRWPIYWLPPFAYTRAGMSEV